jgi:hypothetical protein
MCLLLNGHLASGDSSRSQALHPIMSVLCAIVVSLIRCTVAEAISSSWSARGNLSINSVALPKSRKGGAQIEGHQHSESRVCRDASHRSATCRQDKRFVCSPSVANLLFTRSWLRSVLAPDDDLDGALSRAFMEGLLECPSPCW